MFEITHYPEAYQLSNLAKRLRCTRRKIDYWFQSRRSKQLKASKNKVVTGKCVTNVQAINSSSESSQQSSNENMQQTHSHVQHRLKQESSSTFSSYDSEYVEQVQMHSNQYQNVTYSQNDDANSSLSPDNDIWNSYVNKNDCTEVLKDLFSCLNEYFQENGVV